MDITSQPDYREYIPHPLNRRSLDNEPISDFYAELYPSYLSEFIKLTVRISMKDRRLWVDRCQLSKL